MVAVIVIVVVFIANITLAGTAVSKATAPKNDDYQFQ